MSQSTSFNESGITAARIEAQDVMYIEPMREYLERFGCRVVVNASESIKYSYVICVGEAGFVKSFFVKNKVEAQKILAIIYDGDTGSVNELFEFGVKVYLTDPIPLTDRQTKEIFAFFITSKRHLLDARKEPKPINPKSVISKGASRESHVSADAQLITDANRIAKTMLQIFSPSSFLKTKRSKSRARLLMRNFIVGFIVLCIIPLFLYCMSILLSAGFLAASGKALLSGNLTWTETYIKLSKTHIQNSQTLLRVFSPILIAVRLGGYAEDEDRLLTIFSDAAQAESGVIKIFKSSKDVGSAIFFPKNSVASTSVSDVAMLTGEVSRVSQHLALIQAELDSLLTSSRFPFQSVGVRRLGKRALTALAKIRTLVSYTEKLLTLYPQMGGFRRRQTFLVLLQNSMELRPTGGFIGSMLLISFTDGAVDDMHVLDVYDADGQLKGHVDPPPPIREILGSEHWYLRDSNWDPDFSISGKQASWFYEKEMGQSVDGVIGISLPLVTNLLRALGPVELPDFNERISENNFFAKSLLYTQTDFFPGSTQKKDFLGALTSAMLLRMTEDRSLSAGPLLRTIADSIQTRDIQFYFSSPVLQQLVTQWGWDGGMQINPCQTDSKNMQCVGDGIGIIEANLGVNKTNFFVTHEALSDITIQQDGSLEQTLTVKIRNTTPAQTPLGGGPYQTYVRVYYPAGSIIQAVKLDGVDVGPRDIETTENLTLIGIPFTVQPRQEHQLMIVTKRNISELKSPVAYQFSIRKQAGVSTYPWHVVLRFPSSWTALSDSGIAKPGILEYNTDLMYDADIRVFFQKQ